MQPFVETTIIGALDPCRMPAALVIDLMEEIFSPSTHVGIKRDPREKARLQAEELANEADCPCKHTPESCGETKGAWRALRIKRKCHVPSSVSLTRLMQPLSVCGLDVLVASGKGADFVMVKDDDLSRALDILRIAGHRVQTLGQQEQTHFCYRSRQALFKEQNKNKNEKTCCGGAHTAATQPSPSKPH